MTIPSYGKTPLRGIETVLLIHTEMASGSPSTAPDICAICHESLILPSNDDPLTPSFIIDDVQLRCNHHFHWSCILEYASSSEDARERCSLCRANVLDRNGNFIVNVRNEGGFTGGFDFGNEIDRVAFLAANPEIERKEVFMSLMAQYEFEEAEKFLKGEDHASEGKKLDPNTFHELGRMTAMHMAALNDDTEGIELLLKYGADRNFKTEDGETALDLAKSQDAKEAIALLSKP